MKKRFGLYIIVWAVLLALFNVIAFVAPGWEGIDKYTSSFWIGYACITAMFIAQLVCSIVAFRADSAKKMFYNISLIRASFAGLVLSFVVGGACMLLSTLAYWIGTIVCAIILVLNVIAVVKAKAAIDEVERVDAKIKTQTFFIKALTINVDTLMAGAASDAAKAECRKVYETVRYSDPMSSEALAVFERGIMEKFSELSDAVKADDIDSITKKAKEMIVLVEDRNQKCKLLK